MGLDPEYQWQCHPQATRLINQTVNRLVDAIPFLDNLRSRMLDETGTRLVDWIDHLQLPTSSSIERQLVDAGFQSCSDISPPVSSTSQGRWHHPGGLFPEIVIADSVESGIALKVESVADFLAAHQLNVEIEGAPHVPLRKATVARTKSENAWVIERHGCRDVSPPPVSQDQVLASLEHAERLRRRPRNFADERDGFSHAAKMFEAAKNDLGVDWACDLFFAAERDYWQRRNRAARVQKSRQDRLGLGWANHDHHTYRCSREHFARLISLLETMDFHCRERFYGGADAGWGAQVMEQPAAGIVIFADVDLSPQEVTGDFAHQGLAPRSQLGTVGLWCALHGEAMLQAGMHHLECQFEFEAARSQLATEGIETMSKFTDFPFLKQAFTKGEVWPVAELRLQTAQQRGSLTHEQVERFRIQGAIGSHLEILQRDDGYKGFNQTGISQIIRGTDPRLNGAPD
jgi:hypothetical protein